MLVTRRRMLGLSAATMGALALAACNGNGGDTEIGFNGRYLRDALRASPTDELTVCINTGSAPCIIVPSDGSDTFVFMVLPVRLAK